MIITCENCNKKFNLNNNLISKNGRFLQCGNCKNKWFFKPSAQNKMNDKKLNLEFLKSQNEKTITRMKINDNDENNSEIINKKIKKNTNFISYFLVILISLISLIIIADTFKEDLKIILPYIMPFLDSLYETLYDLQLFIKDLLN